MKLKQNQTIKNRLNSTLKSWLPILQSGISELEETLNEYVKENPFIELKSNIKLDFSSALPKKYFDRVHKSSISEKIEAITIAEKSLYEILNEQIVPPLFPTEISQQIAYSIIEEINEDGYFDGDIAEIAKKHNTTIESVEKIRLRFAYLEPVGIGSKNMKEALLFQLDNLDLDNQIYELAKMLINDLENLTKYKKHKLFDQALKCIQNFKIPPAIEYHQKEPEIIPDIFVYEENGTIEVKLNDNFYPEILIENSIKEKKDEFVKQKIKEAKDLIDALEMRKATLFKIGLMIVEYQYEFFMGGNIKPMKLKDLADEFNHAPSTISRAIANKYLECNRGIFPLKSFFATAIDDDVSNSAIKAYIEELVKNENKQKPLSDLKILELVEKKFGIKMVRRTITKYRKQLNIASSSERKKLYEISV